MDFRLPLDWKNLLKTACLAGAGPAAAAPPPGGFRRDIAARRRTARGTAESARDPAAQFPGVCGTEHVAPPPCAGAGTGRGRGLACANGTEGAGWPQFGAKLSSKSLCG